MKLTKKEIKAFEEGKERLIWHAKNNSGFAKYHNGICEVTYGIGRERLNEILYHYKPEKKWKYGAYIWNLNREGYRNRLRLINKILKDNKN